MGNSHYPSLFLMVNNEHAHWYKVEEDAVTEIETLDDKQERYSDREGPGGAHGASLYEGDTKNARKEEHEHHHYRLVAEKTKELWGKGEYSHLAAAISEEYKHLLETELGKDLPQVEVKMVFGNYGHGEKNNIHELFLKSLRPAWEE